MFDDDGMLLGVTRMVQITDYPCFHEKACYSPGDNGARVYDTTVGRVGVAICYDRHYPEYMRALGVHGAQLVAIPQAGAVDDWPDGPWSGWLRKRLRELFGGPLGRSGRHFVGFFYPFWAALAERCIRLHVR